MSATTQSQLQRAELDAVIQSGIFHRAPNLSSFLIYICERHFEGAGSQIKEYNIAVEALGRGSDFDQKKDSIVRVEAMRLRKRLAEYYAGAGAHHRIHILIPNGQYAPKFVDGSVVVEEESPARSNGIASIEAVSTGVELSAPDSPIPVVRPRRPPPPRIVFAAVVLAALLAVVVLLVAKFQTRVAAVGQSEVWSGASAEPASGEFRMLAGYHGKPFVDRQGHRWLPDIYYGGGRSLAVSSDRLVEGLPDPGLPLTMREGNFRYDIPLRPGTYELHLYFSETNPGQASSEDDSLRAFQVRINGSVTLDLFDPLSEAGAPNRLHVRVFKDVGPAKDGKLHLEFSEQSGPPVLNAIEILSSVPGRIRPIRIVARKSPVTDGEGHVWAADEFVIGGHLVERATSVLNTPQKNLFEGERFGNFTYHLPVAPGKYRLTLHFAETYFGGGLRNSPPYRKGSRLFDVFVNGVAVLRNFDVAEAAGGPNRSIERTFDNLEPNAQGLIVLDFRPLRNYACLNAIELEEIV